MRLNELLSILEAKEYKLPEVEVSDNVNVPYNDETLKGINKHIKHLLKEYKDDKVEDFIKKVFSDLNITPPLIIHTKRWEQYIDIVRDVTKKILQLKANYE